MELSINNINLNRKHLSFKGLEGSYDKNTVPVFKFYVPPYDKSKYNIYLEFAPLARDEGTAMLKAPKEQNILKKAPENEDGIIEVPQKLLDKYEGFGYRFRLESKALDEKGKPKEVKFLIDSAKSIPAYPKGERINVIESGNFYGASPKGGPMRHSFIDSDVRLNYNGEKAPIDPNFVRTHFNKLKGDMAGLTYLLKNTDELEPYRYIMTTPDIGVDIISSHKYWPTNQYQCTNLDKFKEFNWELFKKGKGYVADGAFTSQGLQSPLVQHVLKWGEKSPFYHWMKFNGKISLGVLPDSKELFSSEYKHIGVRLVNGKGADYDKTKPTYIQFYDDRLLDEKSQVDGKLHFAYNKEVEDPYEITTHQDSVQPYAFEIDPDDKKLKAFKNQKAILLEKLSDPEEFLTFANFKVGEKEKISGITCWDGNVDMIKMNLSNPSNSKANIQGLYDAREYIFGVATYWTNLVQSHLILETAKADGADLAEILESNDISETRWDEIKDSVEEHKFVSRITKGAPKTEDIVKAFPLQSIETSRELSAIFTEPEFQKALLDKATKEKVASIFDTTIQSIVPEQYKNNNSYKNYIKKLYGNEILKHIYVGAMCPQAINQDGTIDLKKLENVTLKSLEKYKSNSPKEEVSQVSSRIKKGIDEKHLNTLQQRLKKELASLTLEKFEIAEAIVLQGKGGLNWRFDAAKDIGDLDAIRDKKKTFDEIWNGKDGVSGVQGFWAEFVKRIRQSNPASYIINEVTSLGDFVDWNNKGSQKDFDPQSEKYYSNFAKDVEVVCPDGVGKIERKRYELHPVYAKQVQFLDVTNSTTTSEFAKGFNSFSVLAGVQPEANQEASEYNGDAGNLKNIRKIMEELTAFNQPNSSIYSHMFVSNHDKPSVLHTLPLNMSVYMPKKDEGGLQLPNLVRSYGDLTVQEAQYFNFLATGDKDKKPSDFLKINAKAIAVGLAMMKTIDKMNYSFDEKNKLKESLRNLVNGRKTSNDEIDLKRAESFGVRPYEITIKDMIKNAGIVSDDELIDATRDFHHAMMKDSMTQFQRMWQVMNACIGVPTLFGGNEFVQTGYETPNKNEYLGIRNEVLHDLKNDSRYKAYFDKMQETSSLYKTKGFSAIRDGAPISLKMIDNQAEIDARFKAKINEENKKYEEFLVQMSKGKLDVGALKYLAMQVDENFNFGANPIIRENPQRIAQELRNMSAENIEEKLKIAKENGNIENLQKYAYEVAKCAIERRRIANLKSDSVVQIWPLYKKDSKGSQTISIITNLGLPYNEHSYQNKPDDVVSYRISSIPLITNKNEKLSVEIPAGYVLKRADDPNGEYTIENGVIKAVGKSEIKLNDTVTTFAIVKKEQPNPKYSNTYIK